MLKSTQATIGNHENALMADKNQSYDFSHKLIAASLFALVGLAGSYFFHDHQGMPQIGWSIAQFVLYLGLWRAVNSARSYVDVGNLLLASVLIYQVFPLISLEISDYNFGQFGDARLSGIQLSSLFLSDIWLIQSLIFIGIATSYLLLRRGAGEVSLESRDSYKGVFAITLISALAINVSFVLFMSGSNYLDEYAVRQNVPTIIAQILNIATQLIYLSVFGLIIEFIRLRPKLAIAICLSVVLVMFATTSARTPIAVTIFALIVSWDRYRSRIPPLLLFVGLLAAMALFLLAGAYRGGNFISDILGQNEFLALYATSLDVYQIALVGRAGDIGSSIWLSDLVRPIPGQLLPFEKLDPALWYASTFYPAQAAQGAGFGFGMVSEAVLSGGEAAGLTRGALLGAAVALIAGKLETRSHVLAKATLLRFTVFIYTSYRTGTFTLLPVFLFQFGPALIVVYLAGRLFGRRQMER